MEIDFAKLTTEIHADNVKAGWWTDLKTGESTLHTRNRPEMLMLAVSEIAEAAEGTGRDLMDDKLTHLPMYDVELADFVIRQFDQIGAEVSCGHAMPEWASFNGVLFTKSRYNQLLDLVVQVSKAMEHYRKGRVAEYVDAMAGGIILAFMMAQGSGIDLLDIIEQKRSFNRQRADHKPENRLKDGGKAF